MESSQTFHPNKNIFKLQPKKDGPILTISSNFDSGNMEKAEIGLNGSIIITPANDCSSSESPSHSKGWFYFSISGVPSQTKIKIIVKKMSQLSSQIKLSEYFRPVYQLKGQEWQRVEQSITKEDDTELHFDFFFTKLHEVFFAYSYPFSYENCEAMLKNILKQIKLLKHIYYKDQIMIKTKEDRNIHLLTLSSIQDKQHQQQPNINQYLFSQSHTDRPYKFKQNKRVIIITARVHPGQVPSSHTFNGLLKFLLSNDARANVLRKNFVFKMVPILNPDGVYHGHHRMDMFGQNLNRFYQNPDVQLQPSVYAVKKIGQYYKKDNKLCFYIDLHAHPQKKGNFIYGNSLQNQQQQVQTQLFAKILSLNCIQFDYINSSFSKYHMNAKDKNEDLTKQGCGRVVFNQQFQLPYTYTLQCGYTCSNFLNEIAPIQNAHRKYDKYSIIPDQLQNIKSSYYSNKKLFFTIKSYENLGKNILVSILDLFQLNPASRIPNTFMKNLHGVRVEIQNGIAKANNIYKPIKPIFTQQNIRPLRIGYNASKNQQNNNRPAISSNKQIALNRLRNRTLAKVNIGFI